MVVYHLDLQRLRVASATFPFDAVKPSEVYLRILADKELHTAVHTTINYFELVSLAILRGYVDEPTMYLSLCVVLPWTAKTFAPYTEGERRRYNDRAVHIDVERLSNAWSSGRLLTTNEVAPKPLAADSPSTV